MLLSSVVLGIASAAGPLFVSSAGSAAVRLELQRLQPEALGVSVTTYAVIDPDPFEAADEAIRAAVKTALPGVGEPETLMLGTSTARLGRAGASDGIRMQFAARTGAVESLDVVDGDTTNDGVWVPNSLADGLGLRGGDLATMLFGNARANVRIAGIYRDLRPPLSDYWSRLAGIILPRDTPTGTQAPELPLRWSGARDSAPQDLLNDLGLGDVGDRLPDELSLGEQQRATLARALVTSPSLLLADEPTGHQDARSARRVLDALAAARDAGVCCFIATHDPEIRKEVDRIIRMEDGSLVL